MESPPHLDVLPDLTPDATPMSDPSLNPTPFQDSIEREYFTSQTGSKSAFQHTLPLRQNQTIPVSESQIENESRLYSHPITLNDILGQELNPTNAIFSSGPYAPASKGPCFATPAQAFWYHNASPQISKLLENAAYDPQLKSKYLEFFNHFIIPTLGPIPSAEVHWIPHLSHSRTPISPSWDLCGQDQVTPTQEVGFKFEPIGPLAGTPEDPFNQLVPQFFVSALATSRAGSTVDLELWNHLVAEFFITSAEKNRLLEMMPTAFAPPTCYIAFDLPNNHFEPTLRSYMFPHRRALLEGKTNTEVILNAVKKLHSPSLLLLPAIEKIETLFSASTPDSSETEDESPSPRLNPSEMSLEMVSFDCTSQHQPHLTLYLKTRNTSFSNIAHIYNHLSCSSHQSSSQSQSQFLPVFQQFWECLIGLEEEWTSPSNQTSPFLNFCCEIIPGKEEVDVSIVVPVCKCGVSEEGVREGLRNFFLARGWGIGDTYEEIVGGELRHGEARFRWSEESGVGVEMFYDGVMEQV